MYQLNKNLTINEFSEMKNNNRVLYQIPISDNYTQKFLISSAGHQILQTYTDPNDLLLFPDNKDFLQDAVKKGILTLVSEGSDDHYVSVANKVKSKSHKPSYMLFKITLLRPGIVNRVVRYLLPLTQRYSVFATIFFITAMGIFAIVENYPASLYLQEAGQILLAIFLAFAAVVIHEFGHAVTAYRYGARNISLGIGWYFIFPVAFADLSETWSFPVKQRLLATVAGVFYQAFFCGFIFLFYMVTENTSFYFASLAILVSILWNLNPLLRLDGYWIFSDLINTPNLRSEAFSYAKQFVFSPRGFVNRGKSFVILIYGIISFLLIMYFLLAISYEVYRTKGFGVVDVYQKILSNSNWGFADWLLAVGTMLWKVLALTFLFWQMYSFFYKRIVKKCIVVNDR